jgi:hypothetical protein
MSGPSLFYCVRLTRLSLFSGFLFSLCRVGSYSVLIVIGMAALATADTFEWTDPVSSKFNDASRWTNTDLPPVKSTSACERIHPGRSPERMISDGTEALRN